jgi:acetylxylan esterase
MSSVLDASQASYPDSDVENVDYPATLDNYASSSGNGTEAVSRQLTAFVKRCPASKIVLLGYSQVRL